MPNKGNETCHIFVNWIPPLQIKAEEKQINFFFRVSGNFMKVTGFGPGNSLRITGNYLERCKVF
jgi:hypothetical protein